MKLLVYQLDQKYKKFLKIFKYFINEYANANNLTALNMDKIYLIEDMIQKGDIKSIFILPKNVFPNFFSDIIRSSTFNKNSKIVFNNHTFINIRIDNLNCNEILSKDFQNSIPKIENKNNFYVESISNINYKHFKKRKTFYLSRQVSY